MAAAPIALSLNASLLYLGFSLGSALGSFTLAAGSTSDLEWVGAVCELGSLALLLASIRQPRTAKASPVSN